MLHTTIVLVVRVLLIFFNFFVTKKQENNSFPIMLIGRTCRASGRRILLGSLDNLSLVETGAAISNFKVLNSGRARTLHKLSYAILVEDSETIDH